MTNFLSSLYILEIRSLSDVGLVEIFSHSVECRFVLLTVSFALQKLLSFRRFHLLIVSLIKQRKTSLQFTISEKLDKKVDPKRDIHGSNLHGK